MHNQGSRQVYLHDFLTHSATNGTRNNISNTATFYIRGVALSASSGGRPTAVVKLSPTPALQNSGLHFHKTENK